MAAIVGRAGSVVCYIGETEAIKAADKLAHVTTLSLPSTEVEEIDVTDFDSVGKEVEAGDADYGELQVTQHLNTGNEYDSMYDRISAGTVVYFQCFIKNKEGAVVIGRKGKGVIKACTIEGAERGSAMKVQTTIKVSGELSKVTTEPTE